MSFRIVAGFFALVFGLSIAVQFNDPDPALWIAIYAVAAVLATAAVFGRFWLVPTGAALACYLVLIGIWSPALADSSWAAFQVFGMSSLEEEEVREFWGLAICGVWTAALFWKAWRESRTRAAR